MFPPKKHRPWQGCLDSKRLRDYPEIWTTCGQHFGYPKPHYIPFRDRRHPRPGLKKGSRQREKHVRARADSPLCPAPHVPAITCIYQQGSAVATALGGKEAGVLKPEENTSQWFLSQEQQKRLWHHTLLLSAWPTGRCTPQAFWYTL